MNIRSIKSIAIGSFDGIHQGHMKLIQQVDAVVIIEKKNKEFITPGYKRWEFIKKPSFFYNISNIFSMTPKEFIESLLKDFPFLEKIVVGYDFYFGHQKTGDTSTLRKLFKKDVIVVDEFKLDAVSVHSKVIKSLISSGEIKKANKFLNREYEMQGTVIKGQGLGAKELVPTINLKVYNYILPKDGVYLTKTKIENEWLWSVSFIGKRVSTDGSFAIETHIIDRDITLREDEIEIAFVDFMRDNHRFESLDKLKMQIHRDINHCKEMIEAYEG
jgi:riboflavin kinase/FMN adenylyltransferase